MKERTRTCLGFMLVFLFSLFSQISLAQVKIGSNPSVINPNSVLEIESSGKGFLLPRSTTGQINGMTNVPTGMLVYNMTDSIIYVKRDSGWVQLVVAQLGFNATLRPMNPTAADIYALMPDDNAAPIAVSAPILFPRTSAISGGVARASASALFLAAAGSYNISYVLNIDEPAQIAVFLNGTLLPQTIAGKSLANGTLSSTYIISVPSNCTIELRNVSNTAITLTPNAGGSNAVSAHFAVVRVL